MRFLFLLALQKGLTTALSTSRAKKAAWPFLFQQLIYYAWLGQNRGASLLEEAPDRCQMLRGMLRGGTHGEGSVPGTSWQRRLLLKTARDGQSLHRENSRGKGCPQESPSQAGSGTRVSTASPCSPQLGLLLPKGTRSAIPCPPSFLSTLQGSVSLSLSASGPGWLCWLPASDNSEKPEEYGTCF